MVIYYKQKEVHHCKCSPFIFGKWNSYYSSNLRGEDIGEDGGDCMEEAQFILCFRNYLGKLDFQVLSNGIVKQLCKILRKLYIAVELVFF